MTKKNSDKTCFWKVHVYIIQTLYLVYSLATIIFFCCSPSNTSALTVNNIVQELRGSGVDLLQLSHAYDPPTNILGITSDKLAELQSAHHSTDEQEVAVVRYFLLRDPLASWRKIILQLDKWNYNNIADRIRHYAEELTGMCFFIKALIQHHPCIARDCDGFV